MDEDFIALPENMVAEIEHPAWLICSHAMKASREFEPSLYTQDQKRYVDGLMKIVNAGNDISQWVRGVKRMQYSPTSAEYGAAYSKALLLDEMVQDNHNIAKTYEEFAHMKELLHLDAALVKNSAALVKAAYNQHIKNIVSE